jgi:hypothetical protein
VIRRTPAMTLKGTCMTDWVISFIQTYGLPAIAVLMFLENVFPPRLRNSLCRTRASRPQKGT